MKTLTTRLFLLLGLIIFAASIQAQSLNFGVRAGINSATVNIEDESGLSIEPDSRIGIDIGLLIEIGISEDFSIQPEIHYLQKGFQLENEIFGR